MAVEPTKSIFAIPAIRKEEHTSLSQGKRQKPAKKQQKKGTGKIDIKV